MPITQSQLSLLHAAILRADGLLPRPGRLAGAALSQVETALINTGMAERVPVQPGELRWSEIGGVPTGLHNTVAGRTAAGGQQVPVDEATVSDDAPPAGDGPRSAQEPGGDAPVESTALRPYRHGSKAARLVSMLSGAESTTIVALSAALSWQPHTIRAAITRLRQRGLAITAKTDAGQPTTYRIALEGQILPTSARGGEII